MLQKMSYSIRHFDLFAAIHTKMIVDGTVASGKGSVCFLEPGFGQYIDVETVRHAFIIKRLSYLFMAYFFQRHALPSPSRKK